MKIYYFLLILSLSTYAQKKPLEYATFEDSKYTPQSVGSSYDELREAQKELNRRYDENRNKADQFQTKIYDLRGKETDDLFKKELTILQNCLNTMEREGE